MKPVIRIRIANTSDLPTLEDIRQKAFAPVFESFQNILGDEIYASAQKPEDDGQREILSSMFSDDSVWQLFVAESSGKVVGFVSMQLNHDSKVGEIGLNAVHPDYSGNGIGTEMYKFVVHKMKESGMKVATVATGGDSSHAPARRAYEKSGFNVQIPSVWMCRTL
ncbi:MAG: GNAT family N-acetyltransferase [Cyanobacteria bacterium P01_F01_bin.116]